MKRPAPKIPSIPSSARPQSACIVCGPNHPHGLRLKFELADDGSATAKWKPTVEWEGFRGIAHGGIISAVLDEAMAKAVTATQCEALTGELTVRFRRRVETGEELRVRGWVIKRTKRVIETEATLTASDGGERAHAWAIFVVSAKPQEAERISLKEEKN
jgi:acyl-coenzyme A thioesterase PaaI-like protein